MPYTEGQGRHDDGGRDIGSAHTFEEKSPENYLFQKSHKAHTEDVQEDLKKGCPDGDTAPKIYTGNQDQGDEIQIGFPIPAPRTQAKVPAEVMLSDETQKNNRQQKTEQNSQQFGDADGLRQGIGIGKPNHINKDPNHRKPHFVFIKELFQAASSPFSIFLPNGMKRRGEKEDRIADTGRLSVKEKRKEAGVLVQFWM